MLIGTPKQCLEIARLRESSSPLKYVGVSSTASRPTNIECRGLVDKILAKVLMWATRSILFAGRVKLISSVVFGMFNY